MIISSSLLLLSGSIGLQYINNQKTQKNAAAIQKKRHEFLEGNAKEDMERKMRIMEEAAELREQMDLELHEQRCSDITNECDKLIERLAKMADVSTWPLNVLPMVMRNESFGSYIGGMEDRITVSCFITTPDSDNSQDIKNRKSFTQNILEGVDSKLERFFNEHWNALSTHPVMYYGKAWKRTVEVNDVKIEQLKTDLKHLPTIVVTPIFKDHKLIFSIHLWGMGRDCSQTIDPSVVLGKIYTDDYDYTGDPQQVIDDLVLCLQASIGFLIDCYYWKMYTVSPLLPNIAMQLYNGLRKDILIECIVPLYDGAVDEEFSKIREQDILCLPLAKYMEFLDSMESLLGEKNYKKRLTEMLIAIAYNRGVEISEESISDVFSKNIFLPNESQFIKNFSEKFEKNSTEIKVEDLRKEDFNIDAGKYSEKRDELICIMDDLLKIEDIPENRITEFKRIRKKCLENQFNIVLIGEFQGGKSTTFNAFCGGREISPRGAMIKTSACPITAINISDPDVEEFAIVQWKTDTELLTNIQWLLNKYISPEDVGFPSDSDDVFEPYRYLDLSNSTHIELIKKAIKEEWSVMNNDPIGYNNEIDMCRVADIILTFYNNPVVKEIKEKNLIDIEGAKRTMCSVENVSRIAVFPENWEGKSSQGPDAFDVSEVLFAFVGNIDCYIHCKNLERLGCSVTDCPGLFTSAWDTQVAFNMMPRADAVIYLLGGAKQMTDGDKRALSYIKNLETIESKLFFTINTRAGDKVIKNIIETDKKIIESLGFENVNIHLLNSQLFFLGEFGKAYLENRLDEFSKNRFITVSSKLDIDESNQEECWVANVNDALFSIKKHKDIDVEQLAGEEVEMVIQTSNNRHVFDEIDKFIIDKKAYSILIQCGANVVIKSLSEMETELTRQENDLLKDLATCEAEFVSAQQALDKFQNEAKKIIADAFPPEIVSFITSRAYDKIIRNEKTLVRLTIKSSQELVPVLGAKCKAIAAQLRLFETLHMSKRSEQLSSKLRAIIEPVVRGVLERELGGNITEWVTAVVKGEDKDYKAQIIPHLEELRRKLNEKWHSCVQQDTSIEVFKLSAPSENIEEMTKVTGKINVKGEHVIGEAADIAVKSLINEIVAQLVAVVLTTITMVVLDGLVTGGIATIVSAIVYVISWAMAFLLGAPKSNKDAQTREDLNKGEKRLYDAIFPIMTQELNKDDTIAAIKKGLSELPNNIIQQYKDYYFQQLDDQQKALKENIRKRRDNKQQSLDKQQENAQKAKRLREKHIEPMRRRIESFVLSCKSVTSNDYQ